MRASLLPVALLALAAQVQGQDLPGTYSFAVCNRQCSDSEVRLAIEGHFVLFESATELQDALASSGISFHRISDALARGPLNACYSAVTHQRRIEGDEVYIGIWPAARTQWQHSGSEFRIRLYQSPDASADFIGVISGDTITGINRQHQCCGGGVIHVGHVRAVRTGPPDVAMCAEAGN